MLNESKVSPTQHDSRGRGLFHYAERYWRNGRSSIILPHPSACENCWCSAMRSLPGEMAHIYTMWWGRRLLSGCPDSALPPALRNSSR